MCRAHLGSVVHLVFLDGKESRERSKEPTAHLDQKAQRVSLDRAAVGQP